MPNLRVFSDRPDELRAKIYGSDGTTDLAIKTDSTGKILSTVDALNLDIRNLDNAADSVLIYGQEAGVNRPVFVDAGGYLGFSYQSRKYYEATETATTADVYAGATARDVSQYSTYSFAIKNTGLTNSATVKVQISPNGIDWINDSSEVTVAAGATVALVPARFLRYVRVSYKSATLGSPTDVSLWFEAQV